MSKVALSRILLCVAVFAIVGCQQEQPDQIGQPKRALTSGGDGMFGETPRKPGRYDADTSQSTTAAARSDPASDHP